MAIVGPLLFLLYINDLHTAIKFIIFLFSLINTNHLHVSNSIKKVNKLVKFDLKFLLNWLNANKMSLNVNKTELIMFKP